ncbi:MAG: OB-fold nucleic acid binding domain-containing protein [Candidatus Thorarchaeota archaeon]
MLSLEETIELILKNQSEFDRKDILKLIKEKRDELGPEVVNEESAAMIVARELGIDLQQVSAKARFKIEDISENTRTVHLTAKIVSVGTVRAFSRKDGTEGKVASLMVADDTGKIRVALWDEKTDAVTEEAVTVGSVVQIRGAYVKPGLGNTLELNLGRMGGIRVLDEYEIEDMDIEIPDAESIKIADLQDRMFDISLRAKVVTVYPLSEFTRKSDGEAGKVLSVIVADDSGSTRLVFWGDMAEQMKDLKVDEVIGITGAYSKQGRNDEIEVHSGRSSTIQRDLKEKIDAVEVSTGKSSSEPLGKKSISELAGQMWDVDVEGKVVDIYEVRTFERDGKEGRVQNVQIADESGRIRLTFWNEDVDLIKDLKQGDVILIRHGYVKDGQRGHEFHVGRRAEVEINPKKSGLKDVDISDLAGPSEGKSAESLGKRPISELVGKMWDVDVEGKVVSIYEVRTFERDGKEGRVQNIQIADESSRIRVAFWNENVDSIKDLKEGDIILIKHGYVKDGQRGPEFHVGRRAEVEINPKKSDLKDVDISELAEQGTRRYGRVMIEDINEESENKSVEVSGIVVRVPQSSPVYLACPNCRKKIQIDDGKHLCSVCGAVEKAQPRMLYKVTIDDGSGSIRVTLFGEAGEKLLQMTAEEAQAFVEKSGDPKKPFDENGDKMLGRYIVVNGRVSKYKDSLDISASDLEFADPVEEIQRMKDSISSLMS